MAIDVQEVGAVWILKDMQWGPYDKGEPLLHEATYGFYTSRESAERASVLIAESNSNLPRGNWVIYDEIVYQ